MSYLGSKGASGAWQKIVGAMRGHDVYIEACLGSGVVMKRKPRAPISNIGIEIDARTIADHDYPSYADIIEGDMFERLANIVRVWQSGGRKDKLRILVYIDAPYHPDVRSSDKKYRYDFTHEDHVRLLALVKSLPCDVIVSHYPHPLYASELADWRSLEYQVRTRGPTRTECIWMNFPTGRPFAAEMVGDNHDDRRRIKRKAQRWARMLSDMPVGERHVVFKACCGAVGSSMADSDWGKAK